MDPADQIIEVQMCYSHLPRTARGLMLSPPFEVLQKYQESSQQAQISAIFVRGD